MSELSTSFSSNRKVATVNYSDKINPLIDQIFNKIKNLIYNNKFYESQKYINLISLFNPLSTIEHLKLYFFSFEICKTFYNKFSIKKTKSKSKSKDNSSVNISSNSLNTNIYLIKLFYYIKKMTKYFLKYYDDLKAQIKHIILAKIYQFCSILHKEKEYLMEFYFISELSENEKFNKIMDSNIRSEIFKRKKCLYNELNKEIIEQRNKYTKNTFISEYETLRRNFLDEKYNIISKDLKEGDNCYIISTYWIKTFIYYINIISKESNNEENDIELGQLLFQFSKTFYLYYKPNLSNDIFFKYCPAYPGPLNNYHISGNCNIWYDPKKGEEYTNQFLSNKIIENNDYQIVDEDIYNLLTKVFGSPLQEIVRKIHFNEKDQYPEIEIHLLKYKIIVLCKNLLEDEQLCHLIQLKKVQISREKTFNNLVTKIIRSLNYEVELIKGEKLISNDMQRSMKFHIIIPDFIEQEKDKNLQYNLLDCYYNKYSSFIEKINGKEIEGDDLDRRLEEMKIGEEDTIIIELNLDKSEKWFINIKSMDDYVKCSLCSEPIKGKSYPCLKCNFYIYCSEKCRDNDNKHTTHHKTLDQLYKTKFGLHDMLSVDIRQIINPKSNHGLTGLKNLGNTCFMNSAIQCLSSCEELTKYFLLKKHLDEINVDNNNGAKGKIAKAYYSLIEEIWNGHSKYINPWDFRQIFVSYVKQFAGFSQQDSDEMLTFVLDSLHEDLNRVKTKPYSELKEKYENETEEEASLRWWKNHIDRENSIIVDLFHGQYKSVVKCPECERVSTIYDPFMNLGLPIPSAQSKMRIKYLDENYEKNEVKELLFFYKCDEKTTTREIRSKLFDDIKNTKKDIINNKNVQLVIEGIIVDKNKKYKKYLDDEKEFITSNYVDDKYEALFYAVEKKINIQEYFQCFITPIIISKEEKKNENIEILFFPKIFKFDVNYSVREMYFYMFIYYRRLFKDIKSYSYENFLINLKENNIRELNKEFTEYFEIKELIPFKLHIVNNLTKKDKFSCEYCNRSCKYCSFNFKFNESLLNVKKSQKIVRPFLIYLEVLNYSEKNICNKIMSSKDFAKDLLIKSKEITIYDCFEAFRTEEKLEKDNSWYCSNCKKSQEAFKKLEIYRAPNILIVQLKRFDCKTENIYEGLLKNKKNDSLVVFPIHDLDIRKYVVEENSRKDSFYDLCAISQHYGSLSSGHYTACCINENEWYSFDDETVKKVNDNSRIISKGAYILIFRKKSLGQSKQKNPESVVTIQKDGSIRLKGRHVT